jgi:hypothetical protein
VAPLRRAEQRTGLAVQPRPAQRRVDGVQAVAAGENSGVQLSSIAAISAMVAPVVVITAGGILSSGLLMTYGAVNDRMRAMTRERLEILTGPGGNLLTPARLSGSEAERLAEIDRQLPMLLRRHGLLHNSVLLIYAALAVLVVGVIAIGLAVTTDSEAVGRAALALVLAGTVIILAGLIVAAQSLAISRQAIKYAVNRSLELGSAGRGT